MGGGGDIAAQLAMLHFLYTAGFYLLVAIASRQRPLLLTGASRPSNAASRSVGFHQLVATASRPTRLSPSASRPTVRASSRPPNANILCRICR